MKPIAYDIDVYVRNTSNLPKPGGFGVRYKCPHCEKHFNPFVSSRDLKFCYNCGESLFWGGVIEFINSSQSDRLVQRDKKGHEEVDEVYKRGLLQLINEMNEKNTSFEHTVFIEEEKE